MTINLENGATDDGSVSLEAAIEMLRAQNSTLSLADIAAMLRSMGIKEFEKTSPTTVLRWLNPHGQQRASTREVIVRAAQALRGYRARPIQLKCGVVTNAAEMLPLHLLKTISKVRPKAEIEISEKEKDSIAQFAKNTGIQIQIKDMKSIPALVESLKNGDLDIIAAPRDLEKEIEKLDENVSSFVKRFFKISEVSVKALLPIPANSSIRQIIETLRKIRKNPAPDAYIGVLANGDYGHILASFLNDSDVPNTEIVSDSQDAFEKLMDRKIQGVIGHRIMVENTFALVQHALQTSNKQLPAISNKLQIVGESSLGIDTFGVVKMDVFVNLNTMREKPGLAAKLFHLVNNAIEEEIGKKKISPAFHEKVNALLGLEDIGLVNTRLKDTGISRSVKIEGIKGAEDLFSKEYRNDYKFEIKTFNTHALKHLWV